MKRICIALLVLSFVLLPLTAQTTAGKRGSDDGGGAVEIVDASGNSIGQFKEAHALIIGESDYINTSSWRKLPGVKEDVTALKKLFTEQGFNVETIENANSSVLESGIKNFLDNYGFNPDARIIVYFAGHGATLDLDGRKMGYIIPIDAPQANNGSDFLRKAIPMRQFETWATKYTSRHILFMFDSCFSGSVFRSQGSTPPAISRLLNQPVRQFITSGDANESVPDQSVFRRELENALRSGAGDLNKDGYITGSELGLYLFEKVSNYMDGKQNPRTGKLNDTNLDKGDFIFFINGSPTGSSPAVVVIPDIQPQQNTNTTSVSFVNPEKETKEFFIGTWLATVNYNDNYDSYRISFINNGKCTVTISNDNAEQEGTGNWSWDSKTKRLKVTATFRNAKLAYQRNIDWISLVSFGDDNDYFYILAKPATAAPNNIRFTFYRE
ncbi:MAG: caspase family protein [Treponema sp.]|jgi:hypothetical protein|nr:caspase family protein [Treponema sp.]